MGRPNESALRRRRLLPLVAATFAELGYRRTTTALLAERCDVPENTLFRLWGGKKAMFLATIEAVFQRSRETWSDLLEDPDSARSGAERLLSYEAEHLGEHGLYRIVFAGLSETDDPDVRHALRGMYAHFLDFIRVRLAEHRGTEAEGETALRAWAILGLGTVANIGRELDLIDQDTRRALFEDLGGHLLGPRGPFGPNTPNPPTRAQRPTRNDDMEEHGAVPPPSEEAPGPGRARRRR